MSGGRQRKKEEQSIECDESRKLSGPARPSEKGKGADRRIAFGRKLKPGRMSAVPSALGARGKSSALL